MSEEKSLAIRQEIESQKQCKYCGRVFPLTHFYPLSAMRDGHVNICRECSSIAAREYRRKKRIADPEWAKMDAEERRQASARYRAEGRHIVSKEAQVIYHAKERQLHAAKISARRKLYQAIVSGKIVVQSCEVCGEDKTHGHHDDYSKPLNVRWLCSVHHGELHRRF